MRKFFNHIAFAMLLIVAACGTIPQGNTVPTGTFNDKAAIGERAVLLVQTSSTSMLRSREISLEQDQLIQAQVELVHKGIKLAKSLESGSPQKAAVELDSALKQLDVLKARTGVKVP